jgi:ribosomal protein S18 acetylase RimI-like enzyme
MKSGISAIGGGEAQAGVNIRPARPDDADALAALKLETFMESFVTGGFAIPYPPADLALFNEKSYGVAAIRKELGDAGKMTWIAERGDRMLGYVHVGPTKLPHPDARPGEGELYQIYVRNEAQGLKLGGKLLAIALAHLEETRPGPIWLGVWSGNERAQAIYTKIGFRKVGDYLFPVGEWRDQEFIFRRD